MQHGADSWGVRQEETSMDAYEARPAYGVESPVATAERVTAFLRGVYGWMCVGLGVTAAVALGVAGSPGIVRALVTNQLLFFALIVGELGLVFYLSARVASIAPGTASALFVVYSALNGITLSLILLAYTGQSVASTFVVCAVMFGALALYGTTTTRSLAGIGQFAFMGLIGIIAASIVGIFWHNNALQFVIACAGVVVFTGLTAWDAQRLKAMAAALPEGQVGSYTIVGALSLYLDFINLFLMLLRFMGGRRD
jgi:FtsH-binding integral membrane protein